MHQRARTELCGGRGATRVPTATQNALATFNSDRASFNIDAIPNRTAARATGARRKTSENVEDFTTATRSRVPRQAI